jgi:hypothetical protein
MIDYISTWNLLDIANTWPSNSNIGNNLQINNPCLSQK